LCGTSASTEATEDPSLRLDPPDFIQQRAFEERWNVEDRARAQLLIRRLEQCGVEELRLVPPDGVEARVPGRRPVLSPVAPDSRKPVLVGIEALVARLPRT
jgi:hypothetical protein